MSMIFLHYAILIFIVASVIFLVYDTVLVNDVIYLGLFSSCMAFMFVLLNAPDVALTEAAVGAGLSTVMFSMIISKRDMLREREIVVRHFLSGASVLLLSAALMIFIVSKLPEFGGNIDSLELTNKYVKSTKDYMGDGMNLVTAVLASFRGYDTLGEAFVIFTAAICVILINLGKCDRGV